MNLKTILSVLSRLRRWTRCPQPRRRPPKSDPQPDSREFTDLIEPRRFDRSRPAVFVRHSPHRLRPSPYPAAQKIPVTVAAIHTTVSYFNEPLVAEWISVVSRLSNDRRSTSEVASAEVTQERVGVRGPFHPASRRPESHSRLSKKWPVKGSFPLNAPKVSIVEWRR
jgi:hypothetical protein